MTASNYTVQPAFCEFSVDFSALKLKSDLNFSMFTMSSVCLASVVQILTDLGTHTLAYILSFPYSNVSQDCQWFGDCREKATHVSAHCCFLDFTLAWLRSTFGIVFMRKNESFSHRCKPEEGQNDISLWPMCS